MVKEMTLKIDADAKFKKLSNGTLGRRVDGIKIEDGALVYSYDDGSTTVILVEEGELTIYHGRELN